MRRAVSAVVFLIGACSQEGGVTVCSDDWWRCKQFATAEEAHEYTEAERKKDLAVLKGLDIDYEKCLVTVLAAEVGKQTLSTDHEIYIAVVGEDPTPAVLRGLASAGILAQSVSKRPREEQDSVIVMSSERWTFYVASIRPRWFGGYSARAGYMCGALCAGGTEYRLRSQGESCVVESERWLGSA